MSQSVELDGEKIGSFELRSPPASHALFNASLGIACTTYLQSHCQIVYFYPDYYRTVFIFNWQLFYSGLHISKLFDFWILL